jgi:sulfate transport system substrate-binding protein
MIKFMKRTLIALLEGILAGFLPVIGHAQLLNASFDVARGLYSQINPAFEAYWKAQGHGPITINQSHAGSTRQAQAVIDGLEADVVTLNQVSDIDAIVAKGLIAPAWRSRLPNQSVPYTSTIVFLVRRGNPKHLKDWSDLVKPGISIIVPNPKTSGNGRYSYLAAYAYALKKLNLNDAAARDFVAKLFKNVPILDTGGRGATITFVQHEVGDVLLTFEAEAHSSLREFGADKFEVVLPTYSINAEMPVAVVDKVVRRKDTEDTAKAYLNFLYSDQAQEIIAENYYRPISRTVLARHADEFGSLELFSADDVFGSWQQIVKTHFADGGVFDQIYQP